MNETGAAIVGCGAIYPLHASALAKLDGIRLRAAVDLDPAKAGAAALRYGCEALSDYRELLTRSDIQVVHLCTPHHLHAPLAQELLAAGKHVLTEKPMALTAREGEELAAAAEQSSGMLGVCFQNRYNETSLAAKGFCGSGELGRLLGLRASVAWSRKPGYYTESPWRGRWETEGGGLLMNQAIHTLDLLQWFGGGIVSVKGSVTTDALEGIIEVEDTAHARIVFESGASAVFYATNAHMENAPVELELVFEQGKLIQRRDALYLWADGKERTLADAFADGQPLAGKSYWGAGHSRLIADFYRCLSQGEPFPIDGREGLKAVRLAGDIYASSRERARR